MSKHTPGPWEAKETIDAEGFKVYHIITDEGFYVAQLDRVSPTNKADSRLIVAAPDLLHACKAILAADERGQGVPFQEACMAARKAIAKAEGK